VNLEDRPGRTAEDYRTLVTQLLRSAARGVPLIAFLEDVTQTLLDVSRSGAMVIRLEEWTPSIRSRAIRRVGGVFRFETEVTPPAEEPSAAMERPQAAICRLLLRGAPGTAAPFTPRGALWTSDAQEQPPIDLPDRSIDIAEWARAGGFRSLVLIPFHVEGRPYGLLQMIHERPDRFDAEDVRYFEDVAEAFGLALTHHRVQWALQERVKELTCLYGIAKVAEGHSRPLPEILGEIARLLPPGWQYPGCCAARIQLDGVSYATPDYQECSQVQRADILVDGHRRGSVEVVYLESQPQMYEGPFLMEERNLINEIARQVAMVVEGRRAEEQRQRLQEQLYHADRLATIGKLTAGVAHELNEPLGGILGFAQLARDARGLPGQVSQDLDKIVRAALHAREIIKKLMFFGRQTPPGMVPVDLNETVREGLSFLEPRVGTQKIRIVQQLEPSIPHVVADPGQVLQVLVNLMVNAAQAMPDGGEMTLRTWSDDAGVHLIVEDTGVGMTDDVLKQIFVPFFTTKDVGQGTGLGLSVAHGIVSAHGGTITVTSQPGKGSRFEVRLPAAGVSNE
jgi:two-component system, NtrC family, sensor kinase